jgi:hypothetical protein
VKVGREWLCERLGFEIRVLNLRVALVRGPHRVRGRDTAQKTSADSDR